MYNDSTIDFKKIIDIEAIRPDATPFALLAVIPDFELNWDLVNFNYKVILEAIHPDRFLKGSREGNFAEAMTSWVNAGYQKLKDPIERAKVLLRMEKLEVPGENRESIHSPDIMMEALELKEEFEEAIINHTLDEFCEKLEDLFIKSQHNFDIAWRRRDHEKMKQRFIKLSFVSKTLKDAQFEKLKQEEKRVIAIG